MAVGPGKYDDICTLVRESTNAECVVLLIYNGNKGSGFSVQLVKPEALIDLPHVLRNLANQLELDAGQV